MTRGADVERAARYVAARRGALNLSQAQLAGKVGVDTKTIWRFETEHRWPHAGTRAKIEEALGWKPGDLAKIAHGGEPSEQSPADESLFDDLLAGAGAQFDELIRQRLAGLPEDARVVVEALREEYEAVEEARRRLLRKILMFSRHRPASGGHDPQS